MVQILVLITTLAVSNALMTWPPPVAQAAAGEAGSSSREALEAAESIAACEAAMAAALRAGKPITEVMGTSYEHMLKS